MKASRPPAEAPIPTIGNGVLLVRRLSKVAFPAAALGPLERADFPEPEIGRLPALLAGALAFVRESRRLAVPGERAGGDFHLTML